MRDFANLFVLLRPYRYRVILGTLRHLLMAVFTIISIPLIIPFFHFLFSTRPDQQEKPESWLAIVDWLQYYFLKLIEQFGEAHTLIITCAFIVVTIFLKNLFRYLALYIMVPVRSDVARDLRASLYDAFLSFSYSVEKKHKRGDLITRVGSDVQEIEWNMLRFIDTIIKSPIIIICAVMLMLSISVSLSLFVVFLMVFTALVIGTLSRRLKKQSSELQDRLAGITQHIDESLDGAFHIRIYNVLSWWKGRFERLNMSYKKKFDSVTRRQELSSPLSEFLGVSVVVALLWFGASLVMDKALQAETFFAFVLAFYHVIEPLKSFSTAYYYVKRGTASLDRIHEIVNQGAGHSIEDEGQVFSFSDRILFDNLEYAYDDVKVLDGMSLEIKKGEKIAIVGPSGAGKSTLIRLMLKILEPDRGKILIDKTALSNISRASLYRNVGFVSQHSFLYNDTVRNNITLGRSDIPDSKIIESLKLACADSFVQALENGLDTLIGEHGARLSGGEKQRLTIARALISDPEILIFDEPTSALDAASERAVSQAVINVLRDRTAIIIAHRLSTIKHVNNIFVMDKGRVAESGSHESLAGQGGIYAQYIDIQSIEDKT